MDKERIIKEIIEIFENDNELFIEAIEELDGFNEYLGDDRYYDMELLPELLDGQDILGILNRAFFGNDEGCRNENSNFNPNRKFFRFNAYGNLESTDYIDYSDMLDVYFIESLDDNRDYLTAIEGNPELKVLFDELEKSNE